MDANATGTTFISEAMLTEAEKIGVEALHDLLQSDGKLTEQKPLFTDAVLVITEEEVYIRDGVAKLSDLTEEHRSWLESIRAQISPGMIKSEFEDEQLTPPKANPPASSRAASAAMTRYPAEMAERAAGVSQESPTGKGSRTENQESYPTLSPVERSATPAPGGVSAPMLLEEDGSVVNQSRSEVPSPLANQNGRQSPGRQEGPRVIFHGGAPRGVRTVVPATPKASTSPRSPAETLVPEPAGPVHDQPTEEAPKPGVQMTNPPPDENAGKNDSGALPQSDTDKLMADWLQKPGARKPTKENEKMPEPNTPKLKAAVTTSKVVLGILTVFFFTTVTIVLAVFILPGAMHREEQADAQNPPAVLPSVLAENADGKVTKPDSAPATAATAPDSTGPPAVTPPPVPSSDGSPGDGQDGLEKPYKPPPPTPPPVTQTGTAAPVAPPPPGVPPPPSDVPYHVYGIADGCASVLVVTGAETAVGKEHFSICGSAVKVDGGKITVGSSPVTTAEIVAQVAPQKNAIKDFTLHGATVSCSWAGTKYGGAPTCTPK